MICTSLTNEHGNIISDIPHSETFKSCFCPIAIDLLARIAAPIAPVTSKCGGIISFFQVPVRKRHNSLLFVTPPWKKILSPTFYQLRLSADNYRRLEYGKTTDKDFHFLHLFCINELRSDSMKTVHSVSSLTDTLIQEPLIRIHQLC